MITRIPSIFLALCGSLMLSGAVFAGQDITVTEPYFARQNGSYWKSFDPETNPPQRGEYIRIGFRFATASTLHEVKRSHSVRNQNGREYDFDVDFKGVIKMQGKHITYVSFKVPGNAPDTLSYTGEVMGRSSGKHDDDDHGPDEEQHDHAAHPGKIAFDFPGGGDFVEVRPNVRRVWVAPVGGSVYQTIPRPLRAGEIVRLAVQFYTERSYEKTDDHLDVIFDIEDIAYRPVAYSREVDGAGYHVSYRHIMVPTTEIGEYSPAIPWRTTFSGTIVPHSTPEYADWALGEIVTGSEVADSIPDPIAPALYISKKPPSEFLNPYNEDHYYRWKLKSDPYLRPGDKFYTYIVWKETRHQQRSDMVMGTRFEIPEAGLVSTWKKRWRQRTGYSYKGFIVPEDTELSEITFNGALDAIGGSGARVYGNSVEIKIKEAKTKEEKPKHNH